MDRVNLGYSLKNIPIPSQKEYLNLLISQTEKFMKRMRWKLFFYKQKSVNAKSRVDAQNFGFKSIKTPPSDTELKSFEEDLRLLLKNVKFKQHNKSSDIE